ncbi:MAG TPA: hypothetical protein VKA63_01690 [Candidatus Krumholzibacteria bacterium]|nr:hypothetical protein [Candidatus Krumholzibacteria bacterium]
MKPLSGRYGTRRLRRVLISTALSVVAVFGLGACSTYSSFSNQLRGDLLQDDLPKAVQATEKKGGDDPDVLNLLQRGLLYHYAERYEESNQAFQLADTKIEDQFTKSISGQALAFLTNDATLPYSGYPHEQVLMHVYGALNYLFEGNHQDALVECRRAGLRLDQLALIREDNQGYTDDAFTEWLSGMIFAEDRDGNATLVAARRGRSAYEEYQKLFGTPMPKAFILDYLEWARRFGFSDEANEILNAHPELGDEVEPLGPDEGRIVLIYESGFVNHLEEDAAFFPILESDEDKNDAEMATVLTRRGRRRVWVKKNNVKVAYWLRVALPAMVSTPPVFTHARLVTEGHSQTTELAEDVSAIAQLTFDEGAGKRLLRTILRALAKWRVTKTAQDKGELSGFLANLTSVATERADTRSWSTLPDRIHVAQLRVPAGDHRVVVECLDSTGRVGRTATFDEVRVEPGESTILRFRTYR